MKKLNFRDHRPSGITALMVAYDAYIYDYHMTQTDLDNMRALIRDLQQIEKTMLKERKELI